ncbi:response regulator [Ramlibacter humi]|uniref:Response regulator transcription factor n=1 Tax=Ramlibacter humi TaxID=2530451 RepID=A0A4Z0BP68_9BURK|nr:response regulator transcription factor [Ramlibacter humi]TFZ00224.1 response regulator transcription factor [Ramlibacter humi]
MPLNAYIVEDHDTLRESLAEALAELAGVRTVGQSASAKEAIAWLTDPAHAWDIAIVDLVLERGGHGSEVLRALKHRDPARKVVVLTATADPLVREQCLALGSDGVFDKAMETEALIDWCAGLGQAA